MEVYDYKKKKEKRIMDESDAICEKIEDTMSSMAKEMSELVDYLEAKQKEMGKKEFKKALIAIGNDKKCRFMNDADESIKREKVIKELFSRYKLTQIDGRPI
jgi:hypothetical protein